MLNNNGNKGYSTFPKALWLEPHHQIVCHMRDTNWGRGSYPTAEMQSSYYITLVDWSVVVWSLKLMLSTIYVFSLHRNSSVFITHTDNTCMWNNSFILRVLKCLNKNKQKTKKKKKKTLLNKYLLICCKSNILFFLGNHLKYKRLQDMFGLFLIAHRWHVCYHEHGKFR